MAAPGAGADRHRRRGLRAGRLLTARDDQRLAFGTVAELYDRARPSYPAEAVDALMARCGLGSGDTVVEVGAGTGKATSLLVDRGLRVVAIEPSAEMAALLRARGLPDVRVAQTEFETWTPDEAARAVVSVQAWHWIDPASRYARAGAALVRGGALAAVWTFPDWSRCSLRDELAGAYARAAPQLAPDFPMHPASRPTRLAGEWEAEIAAAPGFAEPVVTLHPWEAEYDAAGYVALLRTHQDHILLADAARERLLGAVAGVVGAGTFRLPFVTRVCTARRVSG